MSSADDLTTRLRGLALYPNAHTPPEPLREAADRIDRLVVERDALQAIMRRLDDGWWAVELSHGAWEWRTAHWPEDAAEPLTDTERDAFCAALAVGEDTKETDDG